MSRLRTLRPLDAVEPKFVDNRQIRPRVVAQTCGKRFVGEGSGQVGESLGGSAIQNAVALDADLLSQRLDDVTLCDSTPADQDQVIAARYEIAAGQFFDLHAVEGLASGDFNRRRNNLILVGWSGIAKSHIIQALGQKVCVQGYRVLYGTSAE